MDRTTKGYFVALLICIIILHLLTLAKGETLHWLPSNENWSISIPITATDLYEPPTVYFRDSAGRIWKSITWQQQTCQD